MAWNRSYSGLSTHSLELLDSGSTGVAIGHSAVKRMSSKVLTLLLSLAAQSGVYAHPTGPRAIAEISTALVLLDAPSRAWAFTKYSPGSENVCGEACEWDAIAYTGAGPFLRPAAIQARPLRPSGHLRRPRRLPRAQVFSPTTEITVSDPGMAGVQVRDPRLLRPPARKRRNETQARDFPFTFKCYGADATATPATPVLCDGP